MRGIFHLGISFICLFRVIRVIFCAFITDKVDGVVDKRSGGTTSLDAQTLLEACFFDIAFSGKKQNNFRAWYCHPQALGYQDFWNLGCQIKGLLPYLYFYSL